MIQIPKQIAYTVSNHLSDEPCSESDDGLCVAHDEPITGETSDGPCCAIGSFLEILSRG